MTQARRKTAKLPAVCGAALGVLLVVERAWAATGSSAQAADGGAFKFWLIAGVVVFAVLLTAWLYDVGRRTSQVKLQTSETPETVPQPEAIDAPYAKEILQHVGRLGGDQDGRRQVVQALSSFVSQQIEDRLSTTREQLTQKYETLLTERQEAEAKVKRQLSKVVVEQKQTESVLKSIAEGLVVVDNQGKVMFMNPAAERLLAMNKEEKLGKSLSENVREEQLISLVKPGEDQDGREIELNAKLDQTKRVVRASNAVVQDENGRTVGMVSVLSDVTKQRELDRLKSEFVSKVTHELRTPLVAIKHSLAVLFNTDASGPLSDTQNNFLSIADRNVERLSRLINDLLDLSKLEARKMELHYQPSDIAQVIGGVCESVTAWIQAKSLTVRREFTPGLPQVEIDPDRVGQVIQNLVGNAIKFTPKGGTITVAAAPRTDSQIEVSVSDTGAGIAKNDLPKLFQKFQQVGQQAPGEVAGTGLGLAIAKEIVELHGGKIWVESTPGQGATFRFLLPVAASKPQGAPGA